VLSACLFIVRISRVSDCLFSFHRFAICCRLLALFLALSLSLSLSLGAPLPLLASHSHNFLCSRFSSAAFEKIAGLVEVLVLLFQKWIYIFFGGYFLLSGVGRGERREVVDQLCGRQEEGGVLKVWCGS
jgi:hypothetical protein